MTLLTPTLASRSADAHRAAPDAPLPVSIQAESSAGTRSKAPNTVDEVLAALYSGVSGPANQKRDWPAFAQLFVPGARIGVPRATRGAGVSISLMDVAAYGELYDQGFKGQGFFEREIHREQSEFGAVLHVWSVYESRRVLNEAPYSRGANSIQMVRTMDGWRIAAITWDHERSEQRLTDRFPLAEGSREANP